MKVLYIGRDNTDYAREVTDWLRDFERQSSRKIELLDPDTIEGEMFARAHDIVEYPTLVAVDGMGKELARWQGTPLPRIDEVSYYAEEK